MVAKFNALAYIFYHEETLDGYEEWFHDVQQSTVYMQD